LKNLRIAPILGLSIAILCATSAAGAQPTRETDTISFAFRFPAGEICDFRLRDTVTITVLVASALKISFPAARYR
jgi:hypothetical protein